MLREKYPDHHATVKIEQEGLKVRLIVESENGDREIIEKALKEYELVVRGETPAEAFFDAKDKILELRNELRIAQLRIESQRDFIAYQGQELLTLKQLIGRAFSAPTAAPVTITVNPTINVDASSTNTSVVETAIPSISEGLQHLIDYAKSDAGLHLRLLDLEESVRAISGKRTPENVENSSGLQKLKRFLDEAGDAGSSVGQWLGKISEGFEVLQKLGRKYNAIAAWCGAPQVPGVLLGKKE